MNRAVAFLLSLLFLISFPLSTPAEEETTNVTEEVSTIEETTEYDPEQAYFDYWVVPMSSQIKVTFSGKDQDVRVGIYISNDGENFEYLAETNESYFLIDNLEHQKKYFVRLLAKYEEFEYLMEMQEIRVK